MRTFLAVISLAFATTLFGCSTGVVDTPVPATSEHHGGILIPLTDKQAYVELLNGKREKKGKEFQTTLVAYLLESDQQTPFSGTATVEVKLGTAKGDQVLVLKPEPDSADPQGKSRFVSAPGSFELNQAGGEITVQAGGKTLSGTFRGPR